MPKLHSTQQNWMVAKWSADRDQKRHEVRACGLTAETSNLGASLVTIAHLSTSLRRRFRTLGRLGKELRDKTKSIGHPRLR